MTSRRSKTPRPTATRRSTKMVAELSPRGHRKAGETTGWLLRPFTLAELVNVGVYVFINHRLKQYYVGQTRFCFGARFLQEVGRRLANERTTAGYIIVFEHEDTEIIYERAYSWTQIRRFHCDLDSVEGEVFREYRDRYPNYCVLNKRNVKKWNAALDLRADYALDAVYRIKAR
jgi:hypothetical protein